VGADGFRIDSHRHRWCGRPGSKVCSVDQVVLERAMKTGASAAGGGD